MTERRDERRTQDLSDEPASHRSQVDLHREKEEKAEFGGTFSAPGMKGEFKAALKGGPTSPYAVGIAVVLLSCAAGVPVALLALITTLSHPPAVLTTILSTMLFLVVFGVGTMILKTITTGKARSSGHSPPPPPVNGTEVLSEHFTEITAKN